MTVSKQKVSHVVKRTFSLIFVLIFLFLAFAIVISLMSDIFNAFVAGKHGMQIFLSSINTGIIALAVFELATIINTEYAESKHSESEQISGIQRALPKFIGMVCVALSLEGLIMVIKYSQLDLAGNLYYPVAIITSTALLLAALGLFVYLTRKSQ
ncbi:hypothetical protein PSECIP111951_03684 [Pseudoalteromonas holothuriae]|uniref:DUF2975 domain-containing protein n=1 Tax=Pseudoalteromonas holothuriae TaxID=2963714 RepID=A0A9W4R1J9_9GAMM|nr:MULTISPECIES: hypothetical protein [unclassified Pseudoalteromonas]CAH9062318.1 hypothetical protein PSECIP111854_02987 [Pseudoalteromonas sp. CIP111854]CAH9066984.1 hypothetical protein PSECIP111951_03684 [Pseudoalteromonas sp. CIP111951]